MALWALGVFLLLLAPLSATNPLPNRPQVPFSDRSPDGQPRFPQPVHAWRFNTTSRADSQYILRWAQASSLDADIWSVTEAYIDMRLGSSELPHQLSSIPSSRLDIAVPQSLYPSPPDPPADQHIPLWNLSHLETAFHEGYNRFENILEFANELSRTFPHLVELIKVGQSSEGREILAIKIEQPGKRLRPRIVVQGALHARDWVATSTALYFAHALVVPQEEPDSMNELLNHLAFTIIPVPNPDGYVYTWDHDRLWYKNRLETDPNNECIGIDMNRNWGYHWDNSLDPCHHWYGGEHPFDAPEVNAIAYYIERTPYIRAFIDMRSYGQLLAYPFSYSCEAIPAHAENLIEAALGAAKASKNVHGMAVATGSACNLLYPSPGNVIDWAYATAEIPFSYSIFLRDTGTYGFMLPEFYIRPVGEETSVMIQFIAKAVTGFER